MSNRTKWIIGLGLAGAIGAVAFVWFVLLGGADDPVSLDEAVGAVTADTTPPDTVSGGASGETAESQPPAADDTEDGGSAGVDIDGTWTVDAGLDSFVGYRVSEDLDPIGSATATGRTRAVVGRLEVEGTTITDVFVDADVSQLESDRDNRDRALRSRGLESSSFPQATFALAQPIDLIALPTEGDAIAVEAIGDLTAHGVTRSVIARLEAQLVDGVIAVVGTIDVKLSDFEITGLTGFAVLSVEDDAQLEFQLLFSR